VNIKRIPLITLILIAFSVIACTEEKATTYTPQISSSKTSSVEKVYSFGIHPLHNPKRLHDVFGPMMEYLNNNFEGIRFEVEASRNYAAYDEKLYSRKFQFSLPNPFQTINSLEHGYRVFGKMGDDDNFKGIILTRKDSGIKNVTDLTGKPVSFPAPTALAATMMPQYYLHTHGIDVMKDIEIRYVGSQESSIMNVFLGDTLAGATWPPPWQALVKERPELADQMEIKWQTDPLPNNGLVVRDDVPQDVVEKVSELVFNMHTTEKGKIILQRMGLSKFEQADNNTYQAVVDFVKIFSESVRPVK